LDEKNRTMLGLGGRRARSQDMTHADTAPNDRSARRDAMDHVALHARLRPRKLAIRDLDGTRSLTYAQLDARVERCVSYLTHELGPLEGERIATLARNRADLLVLQVACARLGAIYTPLNWRLAAPEISFLTEDSAPRLLVHDAEFDALAAGASGKPRELTVIRVAPDDDGFDRALAAAPAPARRTGPVLIDADAPSIMLYTSGTTGRPKGVLFTERNALFSAITFAHQAHVDSGSVFLCEPPLFHVAALLAASRTTLVQGGTLLISRGFDAIESFRRLTDPTLGVTNTFLVPQMARMMRNAPGFDGTRLAHLRSVISGGAPHPAADVRRWLEDGVKMLDGFGMSEVGSVTAMPIDDLETVKKKAGSCGLPGLVTQLRLVNEQGGDVAPGEVGELWVRTPTLSPGYWKRPDATAASRTPDGWFKTGDAGRFDEDGFLYLVDRLKDMYISGGENVYPAEVEAAIAEMSGIVDVAVIGVPDEKWGEVGAAYVVAAPGASLTPEAVVAHCRARLARFKTPATVTLAAAIPRNAAGKLQKHVLRAEHGTAKG
jgi:fatty-acyl-CoA synthase